MNVPDTGQFISPICLGNRLCSFMAPSNYSFILGYLSNLFVWLLRSAEAIEDISFFRQDEQERPSSCGVFFSYQKKKKWNVWMKPRWRNEVIAQQNRKTFMSVSVHVISFRETFFADVTPRKALPKWNILIRLERWSCVNEEQVQTYFFSFVSENETE